MNYLLHKLTIKIYLSQKATEKYVKLSSTKKKQNKT